MKTILTLLTVLLAFGAVAQEAPKPDAAAAAAKKDETPALPADSRTTGQVTVGGKVIKYTAIAGAMTMRDEKGQRRGDMGFVAYLVDGKSPSKRPITFAFNGGPGSASAWLHLGVLGPKRLAFGNDGDVPSKSPALIDNQETWLDFTDIVFIDPIGTGWSRPAQDTDENKKAFWGVRQDIDSMSKFIALWLSKYQRLQSPKYLAGESYGGFRAPRIASHLQTVEGVGVQGVVVISPVIDFALWRGTRNTPFAYVATLPAMAAAAMEKTTGKDVQVDQLADAEKYAMTDYLVDLMRGRQDLTAVDRMSDKVTKLTGLDPALVKRLGARIDNSTFVREFRRDKGEIGSRYDASVTAYDPYPSSAEQNWGDPILQGAVAPVTSAIVDYTSNVLNWKVEAPYRVLNGEVNQKWEWNQSAFGGGNAADASEDLRKALALDKSLKMLIVHGATDLVTPYMASRMIIDQIPPFGDPNRVRLKVYPGGHMFYTRENSRKGLRDDVRGLYPDPASADAGTAKHG
ncbi:S10 family peptidase [Roseiterribacter gracilis]|uniref:Carboxypeptidase-like protein n=1 Tax=Roseiterribacter gracilis TaxID=2812848 RepID=A0A8S8X7A1_9PROT|nr:carboxypeptidase-like protein [Rhodospirillales bacterium TMPK1]